jgi:putative ABC transport system permease protein
MSTHPSPSTASFAERLFRALLLLFPSHFRRSYGDEMVALFLERLDRARSRGARATLGLWSRTVVDLVATATAERVGRGWTPIGDPLLESVLHEARRGTDKDGDMSAWLLDAKHAVRRLVHSPLFTLAAVAILGVGIGANAAAFSIVDAALFRPAPFARPDEVVAIYQDSDDGEPSSSAYPAYLDIAERTDLFAGVAATSSDGATWDAPGGPRDVSVVYSTSSLFPVLGLQPSRGRWFTREEDFPGAGNYAVVSYRTWRNELGGSEAAVGSTIRLNGQPVTVVGVGPRDFNGAGGALVSDYWLSISSNPVGGEYRVVNLQRREDHWYDIVARLAPDVTIGQASAAMDALALRMGEEFPELDRGRGLTVFANGEVRFHPEVDGILFPVGAGVLAVVGLVLLLACSNLANLLLVRGASRSSEVAVRRALGAGSGRVVRLFLMEALLISLLGGAAGVALAYWAVGLFPSLPIPLPNGMIIDAAIDGRVLAFSTLLALATGLFFGLLPALRATGADVAGALREDGRSGTGGRRSALIRNALVAVQVAVSLVLLVGAGLLSRSLSNVRGADPGVDAGQVAIMGVNPAQAGITTEDAVVLMQTLLERTRALPGVTSASLVTRLPVSPGGTTTTVIEGYQGGDGTDAVEMNFSYVSPSFFETVGAPLVAGREFGPDDRRETQRVVVVNETAAQTFWGGSANAIGKRLRGQGGTVWREVVGVVEDVKVRTIQEAPTPMMYMSTEQVQIASAFLLARTDGDPEALLPALRGALQEAAPQLAPTKLSTLENHIGISFAAPSAAAALMGIFSLLALVLASLGIYAVVSFAVARRSAELGIRIALGAARQRIVGMVVRESLRTVVFGVIVGLGLALLAAPALERLLFEVRVLDPLAFMGGALLLVLVALAASWIPAWRAARADPAQVLKAR